MNNYLKTLGLFLFSIVVAFPTSAKLDAPKQLQNALSASEKKDYERASEIFKKLIDENEVLRDYARYFYAKMLIEKGDTDLAENELQKVVQQKTNIKLKQESQYELGLIHLKKKSYKNARLYFKQVERRVRREENYPQVIYHLAIAERALKNNAAFCRWARKLFVSYPQHERIESWGPHLSENKLEEQKTNCRADAEDQRRRIKNLQWAGLLDKARTEVNVIRKESPVGKDYELDRFEVAYLLHEGEVSKALSILSTHYESQKKNFSFLTTLAVTAARAGELHTAIGSYYSAYKLSPRSRKGREALYQSAFLSYQFQDYDGAAKRFKEFIKVYSRSGLARDAKWHLAWLTYLRGDYEGAYKSLKKLLAESKRQRRWRRSFPIDRVTYWMAMSLYKQQKYSEAKQLFEGLSKDKNIGYYSIASLNRLKKMEPLIKVNLTQATVTTNPSRNIARFSAIESMIPEEEFLSAHVSMEDESEEALTELELTAEESESTDEESLEEGNGDAPLVLAEEDKEEEEAATPFKSPLLAKKFETAQALMVAGLSEWAKWDLYEIEKRTTNREYLKTLMENYSQLGVYNRSSYIAQVYFSTPRIQQGFKGAAELWQYSHPRAYESYVKKSASKFDIPTSLIWGIMKTESHFKAGAISPVGALGLMQVMPTTGAKISELLGQKSFDPRRLLEPDTGILIGSRYLQRLMRKFDNKIPLVAASYNAGPHRVRLWLSSFGTLDMDEFVEHIPFLETRNYVKKVITSYHIYNELYQDRNAASLAYLSEPVALRFSDPVPTKETWEDI